MLILDLLNKLLLLLKKTASAHKKKLIATSILCIGYLLARRYLKTHHIIKVAMFFIMFWKKVIQLLPLPEFRDYRQRSKVFQYQKETPIESLPEMMNLNNILKKIKNKEPGSLEELKFSILSGIILSFVMYNASSFYNLVLNKYYEDFAELDAEAYFESTIQEIKDIFIGNLRNVKEVISANLHSIIQPIGLNQKFDLTKIQDLLKELLDKIFEETQSIKMKVRNRMIIDKKSIAYQKAHNYFTTTLEYAETKNSNINSKVMSAFFKPAVLFWNCISKFMEVPKQEITERRFFCNQYMYQLPLKKLKDSEEWPNQQSKYLKTLVIDEMGEFFNTINFCSYIRLRAEYQMFIFTNRLKIFFAKKVGSGDSKKLIELLPIFHKVVKQEMIEQQRKQQLYERQIAKVFKNAISENKPDLQDLQIHNRILQEVYRGNELSYMERDMQIKYFNERQKMVIRPKQDNMTDYKQQEQIMEFLGNCDKVDNEEAPKQLMDKLKREINNE